MSDEQVEDARRRWAAALRDSNEEYRALLLENNAPASLIAELDFFGTPIDEIVTRAVLPRHPETSAEGAFCHDLQGALNELRAQFVGRAATHAAPGLGQEAMAFLHVDEANHHEGLMAEIERLERAMETAGCPV